LVKIFIVEDDFSLSKLYQMIFELHGFTISGIAINGKMALEMYQSFEEKPDLIIMDYRMPIKNGIETMKEIFNLNTNEHPNILFASADNNIKKVALENGAIDFIEKPFTIKSLIDKVMMILKNSNSTPLIS